MKILQPTFPLFHVRRRTPAMSVKAITSGGPQLLLELAWLRSQKLSFSCEKGRVLADLNQLSRVLAKTRELCNSAIFDRYPSACTGLLGTR
jgi:hypothetical protein